MKYLFLILLSFMTAFSATSQTEDFIRHKVQKSETVNKIAQQYKITPAAIYRLNPDAYNGIKIDQVLLIPKDSSLPATANPSASDAVENPGTHLVVQGETLFSLAKKYNITVDALKKANPIVNEGLKTGQRLTIPGGKASAKTEVPVVKADAPVKEKPAVTEPATRPSSVPSNAQTHIVAAGETKYSIAKSYGLAVSELEKQNPSVRSGLQTGQTLYIVSETRPASASDNDVVKPSPNIATIERPGSGSETTEKKTTVVNDGFANYEVKPQETLFSLSQQFGITQDELIRLNPTLKDGVKTGMILKVPGKGSIVPATDKPMIAQTRKYDSMPKKKIILMLPMNASRMTNDTINGTSGRLKKESFLNLTLDFYAGAMMALDSAKSLGMNVDVKIMDSEESKAGSNVVALSQSPDVKTADAVIGPFYQQYAEKLAESLPNVSVISPLSNAAGKSLPNLYQAMPSEAQTKKHMLDFLASKNGNVIVVNDPKRGSNREMIKAGYPQFKFLETDAAGTVSPEKLKALLVKGTMNYVILDTEKTGMILGATNVLLAEVANYQIQLAIIEPNETLEFEEISMKRLTVLKLLYPSMTRENESEGAKMFRDTYKEKNKIFPSQYATRGFDVTYDVLMRLAGGKTFAESAQTGKSEQVESRFNYVKSGEGYVNEGIYILQYNDDLSVSIVE